MKKYKVEITRTETFVVDVLAKSEEEAKDKATEKFASVKETGKEHYHQIGDSVEETGTIYDVTDTDDPFDAE